MSNACNLLNYFPMFVTEIYKLFDLLQMYLYQWYLQYWAKEWVL